MGSRGKRWLLALPAIAVACLCLFPYAIAAFTALKGHTEVYSLPATILPKRVKWSNFLEIWTYAPLLTYFKNSLIVSLGSTLLALLAATPAAYGLARLRFVGRSLFLNFVLGTRMFSPVVLLVGLYKLVATLGLLNSLWGLVIVNAAFNQAFSVWILTGYFSTIPRDLEEAAWIDGCSRLGALRKVVLPLAAPGIVTAVIFVFIAAWNEFPIALTLISSVTKRPLSVGIYDFIGQYFVEWQYLCACSLVATIPVVVLFMLVERNLIRGLTAGALK